VQEIERRGMEGMQTTDSVELVYSLRRSISRWHQGSQHQQGRVVKLYRREADCFTRAPQITTKRPGRAFVIGC
jgi:hypothetical protein